MKLTGLQIVNKVPLFRETQGFITTFTTACNLFLSWARRLQATTSHSIINLPPLVSIKQYISNGSWHIRVFLHHKPKYLTPWIRVVPQKLTGPQLLNRFPAFYGTRSFITAFTTARHLSLSWARSIQSMPHPTSRRYILILSSNLRLNFPSHLLPSGFPTKILYAPLVSPIRATCPAHLSLLNWPPEWYLMRKPEWKELRRRHTNKWKNINQAFKIRYS